MSHHFLRYIHLLIDLSIVYGESQADKVWEDGCSALLCADGWCACWWGVGFGEVEVDEVRAWRGMSELDGVRDGTRGEDGRTFPDGTL